MRPNAVLVYKLQTLFTPILQNFGLESLIFDITEENCQKIALKWKNKVRTIQEGKELIQEFFDDFSIDDYITPSQQSELFSIFQSWEI